MKSVENLAPAPRSFLTVYLKRVRQQHPYLTDGEAWGNTEPIGASQHRGGNSKHGELHVGSDACYAAKFQIMVVDVVLADHSRRQRRFEP